MTIQARGGGIEIAVHRTNAKIWYYYTVLKRPFEVTRGHAHLLLRTSP